MHRTFFLALCATTTLGAGLIASPAAAQDANATAGEVVVTASRIQSLGFTAPTPTTVIGSEQILQRGAVNVAQVLMDLPAFKQTVTQQASSLGGNFGSNMLDLRGLGTNRTLLLVDGRRHVPSVVNGSVDLNLIPTSLIDRTEVVTGGASASWGSDAVAGVVNIILNSKLQGVRASVSYGQTTHSDAEDYTASLAGGTSFGGGRGHVVAGFEYQNSKGTGLTETARDWSRELWFVVSPNNPRAAGVPSRILSPDIHFSNLLSYSGVIPTGPLANTTFLANGTPVPFRLGSVVASNLMIGGDNAGLNLVTGAYLVNPFKRDVGYGRLTYDLTSNITAFAELSYGHTTQDALTANKRSQGNLTIRVDNAFMHPTLRAEMQRLGLLTVPFGRVDGENGNYRVHNERDTRRAVAGLNGSFGGSWTWDTYYQWGYNRSYTSQANNIIQANYLAALDSVIGPAGTPICRTPLPAAADPGCVPYNPFGAGAPSAAAIEYVAEPNWNYTTTRQQVAAANIRGEPFSLWAGPVSFAAGVEWRRETSSIASDINQRRFRYDFGNVQPIKGAVNIKEVYGELGLPLLRDLGLIGSVDVNAAIRRTDYSFSGAVTSWKIGGTFEDSSRQLRFRITRSRDIRAPNVSELFSANSSAVNSIRDPLTGGTTLTPVLTSGNPALAPEFADTLTYGLVLSPKFTPGFRFSADYYDIDITGVIATLGGQNVVDRCAAGAAELCRLVTRNPSTNALVSILNSFQNQNRLVTRGIDFEASYRVPTDRLGIPGTLDFRALVTRTIRLATTDTAGTINRAGQNQPKWGYNLSATYTLDRFSATLSSRIVGERIFDVTLIGPEQAGYSAALPNSINTNHVPSVTYVNFSAQYRLMDADNRRLVLFGTINNLTDKDPPFGFGSNSTGGGGFYDYLGRFLRVGLRYNY